MSNLNLIKDETTKQRIVERCGDNPISDGLECTNCGCHETFKSKTEPENIDKWFFMIRAFKVDDWSKCTNCDSWFQ